MNDRQDDEPTVLSVPNGIPPADAAPGHDGKVLPIGTRVGDFEIVGLLGVGGFGIVYCAHDSFLGRHVALKEYMPSAFASRSHREVHVTSERHAEMFQAGLRSFINEARMLAHFDHPALVKVYQFWEANGTAYMVMPYYRGRTLKQLLQGSAEPPGEAWLRKLLDQVLDALELLHAEDCFHRDIAPDNILMLDDTRPLLLDFGAARRAIEGMTQAFTVILKQGYAPIEQYAEVPGMKQGPWTDLYALASVVHFAIDGHPPPPAVARIVSDPFVPLATRFAGRYGVAFLSAIDRALAVKAEQRPQSVAEMRALLAPDDGATVLMPSGAASRPSTPAPPSPPAAPDTAAAPPPPLSPAPPPPLPAAPRDGTAPSPPSPAVPVPVSSARSRAPVLAGLAAAVALAAAGLGYMLWQRGAPAPSPATAPAPAPAAVVAVEPPPARPAPPAPSAMPAARPFEPVAALGDIVAGASPGRAVTVQVPQAQVRIGRDALKFSVRASHAGYVYLFMVGSDRNNFWLLFPNAIARDNAIAAGRTMELPGSASGTGRWRMDAGGPPGVDHLVVMVSDAPRRFDGAGLVSGEIFAEFPIDSAAALQRAHAGKAPLFAGTPDCAGAGCSDAYGAAAFTVEEVAR